MLLFILIRVLDHEWFKLYCYRLSENNVGRIYIMRMIDLIEKNGKGHQHRRRIIYGEQYTNDQIRIIRWRNAHGDIFKICQMKKGFI